MSFFLDDPSEHPDALEFEINGKSFDWLLTKSAFEKAEDEGIDLQEFDEVDETDVVSSMESLITLLYIGTLPFEDRETPDLEDFDDVLTPRVAAEIGPKIMARYQGLTDEEVEDLMGKE
jgi:hypothetical protein